MTTTKERKTLKLEITGRHVKVTPALRTFVREKLGKIRRILEGPLEVHAILTVEKHRHAAELVAHGRNLKLNAREVTQDMYSSIGECVDKLETQAKKHKDKYSSRRRRVSAVKGGGAEATASEDEEPSDGASRGGSRTRRKRATLAAADVAPRIVRTAMPRRKPMSVEEAALHVEDTEQGFIVFRNDQSQQINVLYRRRDGSLGLIEPEG